ncbi:hypothetical protein N8Z04_00235 [bacterium]|nr:hypothetical protein [bacterium]
MHKRLDILAASLIFIGLFAVNQYLFANETLTLSDRLAKKRMQVEEETLKEQKKIARKILEDAADKYFEGAKVAKDAEVFFHNPLNSSQRGFPVMEIFEGPLRADKKRTPEKILLDARTTITQLVGPRQEPVEALICVQYYEHAEGGHELIYVQEKGFEPVLDVISKEREREKVVKEVLQPYRFNAGRAAEQAVKAVGYRRAANWAERNVRSRAKSLARKEIKKTIEELDETQKAEIDIVVDELGINPVDYWLDEFMKVWVSRVRPSWTPSNLKLEAMEMGR